MPVTLIHPFHLTSVQESAFVQSWKETASVFAGKPGYLDTKLHQSLDPKARFRFVTVAHWAWKPIQPFTQPLRVDLRRLEMTL